MNNDEITAALNDLEGRLSELEDDLKRSDVKIKRIREVLSEMDNDPELPKKTKDALRELFE